jgi:hypothetical protein
MVKCSCKASFGGYCLLVEEEALDPATGESWTAKVLAPNGQPIGSLDFLVGPRYEAHAKHAAEMIARSDAQRNGVTLPSGAPEWK